MTRYWKWNNMYLKITHGCATTSHKLPANAIYAGEQARCDIGDGNVYYYCFEEGRLHIGVGAGYAMRDDISDPEHLQVWKRVVGYRMAGGMMMNELGEVFELAGAAGVELRCENYQGIDYIDTEDTLVVEGHVYHDMPSSGPYHDVWEYISVKSWKLQDDSYLVWDRDCAVIRDSAEGRFIGVVSYDGDIPYAVRNGMLWYGDYVHTQEPTDGHALAIWNKEFNYIDWRTDGEGRKHDEDKIDWSLVKWGPVEEMVRVLMYGAKKYSADNWKRVPDAEARYRAAIQRHMVSIYQGEDMDPETGLPHLAHVMCSCMFLLEGFDA